MASGRPQRLVLRGPTAERGWLPIACIAVGGLAALASPLVLVAPWFPGVAKRAEPYFIAASIIGAMTLFALPLIAGWLFQRASAVQVSLSDDGVEVRDGMGISHMPWGAIAGFREDGAGTIELVAGPGQIAPGLFIASSSPERSEKLLEHVVARGIPRVGA